MGSRKRLLCVAALLCGILLGAFSPGVYAQDIASPKISKAEFKAFLLEEANAGNAVAKQALAVPELLGASLAKSNDRAGLPQGRFTDAIAWLKANKEDIMRLIALLAPLFTEEPPVLFGMSGPPAATPLPGPGGRVDVVPRWTVNPAPAACTPATCGPSTQAVASCPADCPANCPCGPRAAVYTAPVARYTTYATYSAPVRRGIFRGGWFSGRQRSGGLFGGRFGSCCGR